MKMTTIEYLNLPAKSNSYSNNIFDSDEDDYYYSESEYSDEYHNHVWKRTLKPHPQWKGYSIYRLVTHKIRRTWILIARKVVPNYKYRRLTNSKRTCDCCFFSFKRPQLLPMTSNSRKKQRSKRDASRSDSMRDNVNMEEFFATKTIRPIITLDGEEANGSGPDYDDDMGLDLTVLDEFSDDDDDKGEYIKKTKVKENRGSKAARLLDLSEEDTLRQVQQQQQQ
jgi:hypothetical protein